jgi:hypothetical protein
MMLPHLHLDELDLDHAHHYHPRRRCCCSYREVAKERSIGLSEAVNDLVRAGLIERDAVHTPFRQKSHDLGHGFDYANVAEALETLEGPAAP